jgi:hypothetical protein
MILPALLAVCGCRQVFGSNRCGRLIHGSAACDVSLEGKKSAGKQR